MADNIDINFFRFPQPQNPVPQRVPRIPQRIWNKHRERIQELYSKKNTTLDDVIDIMEKEHNFNANRRQYNHKFECWGLQKYQRRKAEHKSRRKPSVYLRGTTAQGHLEGRQSLLHTFKFGFTPESSNPEEIEDIPSISPLGRHSETQVATVSTFIPDDIPILPLIDHGRDCSVAAPNKHSLQPGQGVGSIQTTNDGEGLAIPRSEQPSDGDPIGSLLRITMELEEQTPSKVDLFEKRRLWYLRNRKALNLATWQTWYGGDFSKFDVLYHIAIQLPEGQSELATFSSNIGPCLQSWMQLYRRDASAVQGGSNLLSASDLSASALDWQAYAGLGYEIATRRSRGSPRLVDQEGYLCGAMLVAGTITLRLREGFKWILRFMQVVLKRRLGHLQERCKGLAGFLRLKHTESEEDSSCCEQANVAILSLMCYRHLQFMLAGRHRTSETGVWINSMIPRSIGFSPERAFLWAARFMLYYAHSSLDRSPLPSDLCIRALNGCGRILDMLRSHSQSHGPEKGNLDTGPFPNIWENSNFIHLWAKWICSDSDFFLHCYSG